MTTGPNVILPDERMTLLSRNLAAIRERASHATSAVERHLYDSLADLIERGWTNRTSASAA